VLVKRASIGAISVSLVAMLPYTLDILADLPATAYALLPPCFRNKTGSFYIIGVPVSLRKVGRYHSVFTGDILTQTIADSIPYLLT
jgi:hypothetical protein